jgi:hypothetical protein
VFRAAPVLKVEMPPWLYAKTHNVLGVDGLIVYRSAAVREEDSSYAVVRDLLDTVTHHVAERVEEETKDMMFGLAELAIYAFGCGPDEPGLQEWLDEMCAEARRFLEL